MDLRDLECVVAVVDHGGFTAAADALYLSQPSLSKRVALLEASLGVPLFHRVGRTVQLTSAGEAFLPHAREAIGQADAARAAVAAVHDLRGGTLHLVALPTIVVTHLVPLASDLRATHPALTVRLTGAEDARTVGVLVAAARCDAGLCDLPVSSAGVTTTRLFDQELVAVYANGVGPAARAKRARRLPIAAFAGLPVVVTPRGTSTRSLVDELFAAAGLEPRVVVETDQRDALVPLAIGGAGVTFVSEPLAQLAAARGAQVVHLDPAPIRPVGLVTRTGPRSPAVSAFLDAATHRFG